MKKISKYNLVILGSDWDLYKIAYSDAVTRNALYLSKIEPQKKFFKFLFKLHFSPKANKLINLPFKQLWCKYWFKNINNKEPHLFLIFRNWLALDENANILNYIRKNYNNPKICTFFQDIIASYKVQNSHKNLDIYKIKDRADLVLTYDECDAKKYGLIYHPTVFSKVTIHNSTKPKCDVFFIGKDKGRLPLLAKVYQKLTEADYNCLFILLNVPEEKRVLQDKIQYIDRQLPYHEILEYVVNAKCLLELIQPGAVGFTYRTLEAIAYNKKLLTNNSSMSENEYFDNRYISIFDSEENIDMTFLSDSNDNPIFENPFKDCISPLRLISFIEKILDISIL